MLPPVAGSYWVIRNWNEPSMLTERVEVLEVMKRRSDGEPLACNIRFAGKLEIEVAQPGWRWWGPLSAD